MRNRMIPAAAAAGVLALLLAFPALAKEEEREPVGEISLTFDSDIEAGEGGDVDVTVDSGSCSVSGVDVLNDNGYWAGGDKPKVRVELSADRDCYFDKSGKSAFVLSGAGAKYSGSHRENDKETMILTVTLEKLEDGDLSVGGLRWDEDNAIAHWDENPEAGKYKVRLCRGGDGIGATYTTHETSFDFSDKLDRPGVYSFKVRVIDRRDNGGDWEESAQMDVDAADVERFVGGWRQDAHGWWFENADKTYPANAWKKVGQFWYFFGQDGYMRTGWIDWEGKQYYCDPESGAMWTDRVTPDGAAVGADGARVS